MPQLTHDELSNGRVLEHARVANNALYKLLQPSLARLQRGAMPCQHSLSGGVCDVTLMKSGSKLPRKRLDGNLNSSLGKAFLSFSYSSRNSL